MNGVVFYRGERYWISDLDVAVLKDVSFTVLDLPVKGDLNGDGGVDQNDLNFALAGLGGCVDAPMLQYIVHCIETE